MATKKKTDATQQVAEYKPSKAFPVELKNDASPDEKAEAFANLVTSSAIAAARVIEAADRKTGLDVHTDVPALVKLLKVQGFTVNTNDLSQAEAMLINQATALQSLFSRLAERGMGCDNVPGFEANLRMALRAQSQCRATLETLATIKNPPVVYAKQANITNGPQQINNGTPATTRTEKTVNQPNELLEHQYGNHLDEGTTRAATGADTAMATVGEIDRAKK